MPGMTACEAASALFKLECTEKEYDILDPDIPPRYGLTEREYEGAMAWMDAEQAARKACYGGRGLEAVPKRWDLVTNPNREV